MASADDSPEAVESSQCSKTAASENAIDLSWNVWKACDHLTQKAQDGNSLFYPTTTMQVVNIMRRLGHEHSNDDRWRSLLTKKSLQHELEECIVVLHHVLLPNEIPKPDRYVLVDACGGKGLLSMLFSLMVMDGSITKIVLLEKSTTINWSYIHACNETAEQQNRPIIETWAGDNLHHYDTVLDKLEQLNSPICMTGIHLCKQLSPSFCGLINGLSKSKCFFACLAPCCLPRAVTSQKYNNGKITTINIQLYETDRQERIDYTKRRKATKQKPTDGPCHLCQDPNHCLKYCPELTHKSMAEQIQLKRDDHAARVPCWKCGELGHYKPDCPLLDSDVKLLAMEPPTVKIDVSHVLKEENPFESYCRLLGMSLQGRRVSIVDPGLKSNASASHDQQQHNWNKDRKSIYMMIA
mmetsp:Transcript_7932/g.22853  ORF Transcript_7932/g.22853 Transcript_7932/m.22853 type:complete len:410 (-) Transcript_7932:171-1400(-)